jgi:hypothetical protein
MDDCHLDYLHHKIEGEKREKKKKTWTTSLVQRSQIMKGPVLKGILLYFIIGMNPPPPFETQVY